MAVSLDAVNQYFSVGDSALLAAMMGVSEFSISAWANIAAGEFDRDHDFICWGAHAASTLGWLYWRDDTANVSGRTNTISGLTNPPDQRVEATTGSWNDTNWYHWVYTWLGNDAAGQKIYKNGVQDTYTGPTTGHATITGYASTVIRFGNVTPASGTNWFHGWLDDIRLYSRILTPNEVMSIFTRRGTDDIFNGMMFRYLLQDKAPGQSMDGTSDEVRDSGEFGYHGTGDSGTAYATYQESEVLSGLRRRSA